MRQLLYNLVVLISCLRKELIKSILKGESESFFDLRILYFE